MVVDADKAPVAVKAFEAEKAPAAEKAEEKKAADHENGQPGI